jgi:bifunctional non-homologous end joining protein LigD
MAFQPMPLLRSPAPFDHSEWLFELKYDGFRSLAVIQNGRCQLISRNGHSFNSYTELRQSIPSELAHDGQTVLDGEIVCLDKRGRPQFRDLLFHRVAPYFCAFDLLMSDGKDLRMERLTDRKHELRRLLAKMPASVRVRYVDHVEQYGTAFVPSCLQNGFRGHRGQAQLWTLHNGAGTHYLVQDQKSEILSDGGARGTVQSRTP